MQSARQLLPLAKLFDLMRFRIQRTLCAILACLLLLSCGQKGLIGKWKPISNKFTGKMQWQEPAFIDLTNTDSLRATLLKARLKELNDEGEFGLLDSLAISQEVDTMIRSFQESSLTLESNAGFLMVSNGFILPNTVPGWHLGDTLTGKWSKQGDTIILNIGSGDMSFSLRYQILKSGSDTLVLREALYNTEMQPGREITFRRE
jgi:hypothetical protein